MTEKRTLATVLEDLMTFTIKYKFSEEDRLCVMDRCILLGEACAFLEELGLLEELRERHKKACKNTIEVLNKL